MKDADFENIIELAWVGGGYIPANQKAHDLADITKQGEVHQFLEVTARDLKFHKAYMSLLGFIYDYLPTKFQETIPKNKFYIFLKHLKGNYKVYFQFKDGSQWIEYDSIAFGNMSQKRFQEYVKNQLPFIYENVIALYFNDDIYNGIVDTIEQEYVKFLDRL
jgi:hypothetical protein